MYLVALKDDIKWNPVHMDTKETCRSVHIKRALKKNHPGQMYNWYKGQKGIFKETKHFTMAVTATEIVTVTHSN